jgi:hypothetical protein
VYTVAQKQQQQHSKDDKEEKEEAGDDDDDDALLLVHCSACHVTLGHMLDAVQGVAQVKLFKHRLQTTSNNQFALYTLENHFSSELLACIEARMQFKFFVRSSSSSSSSSCCIELTVINWDTQLKTAELPLEEDTATTHAMVPVIKVLFSSSTAAANKLQGGKARHHEIVHDTQDCAALLVLLHRRSELLPPSRRIIGTQRVSYLRRLTESNHAF